MADIYKIKIGDETYNLPFLPLSGGTLSGDLTFGRNNTDAFINFNHLDGSSSSWRIGYLGTGSSNANYLVFESTDGNGTGEWKRAFQLGCYNHDATFSGTVSSSKFIGNLQGNADSASYASTIACTSTLDNIARPIVLTSENNKLYYTSKAKINYSDGSLSCGPISSVSLSTTGPISITGTTAETAALKFNRSGASTWNYIIWPGNTNSDCKLAFGYGTSSANSYYYMTSGSFYPVANNSNNLGSSGNKWANVYATTFTGNLAGTADLANAVVCSAASTDIFRPILVTNESNGICYSSKAKLNYSTGAISCGPISSGDIVAGNITTSGNITLNGNVGIYGSNNSNKGILGSFSNSNTWDGIAGYACTVVGSITAPTVIRSSSDDLQHYNADKGTKYKIYDENNLSKSTLGLGNVQNTAFYARQATVNGTTWGLAGTTNSLSTFTIWAPTGTGTAGQFLQSTGAEPQWVSDIKLSNSSGGDSPRLIFERGNSSDSTYDWDIYVKSGGSLKIRRNASGTWNEIMSLYNDNNTIVANWPIVGSLTGNADRATYATTAGTANTLSLGAGTSDVADSTYILTSHVEGWNASSQVYSRPATNLFNYINTKISGTYLPKTGGAITGDLTLYNSGTGNSPALIFQRDRIDNYDSYLDWKIFDSTGNLHFQNNYGDWHDSFVLNYIDNSATLGGNTVYTSGNLTSLKNPNAATIFGVSYDGSSAKTVDTSTLINLLGDGTGNLTDSTMFVTSNASGFSANGTQLYKRDATKLWNYISGKISAAGYITSSGSITGSSGSCTGNATTATLASSVVCSTATNNIYRPILVTNESNGVYYTSKAKLNYSTGAISCGPISCSDISMPSSNSDKFITFDTGSTHNWRIGYLGSGSGDANYLAFQSTKTGGVANGWNSALYFGCETLNATFAAKVSAVGGFFETSDENLKDIISPVETDLDKLSQLRKVYFKFKNDPETIHLGVIAQDVQKIYPEIVSTIDDHLTVDYAKLSVIALDAVDQLNNELKEVKEKLNKVLNALNL